MPIFRPKTGKSRKNKEIEENTNFFVDFTTASNVRLNPMEKRW